MRITKRLRKGAKALATLAAGLLLFGAAACSHDSGGGSSGEDDGTDLGKSFEFSGYKWKLVKATKAVEKDGVLKVSQSEIGVTMQLDDSELPALYEQYPDGFAVTAVVRPTNIGSLSGDKLTSQGEGDSNGDFALASHIGKTADNKDSWYAFSINTNGRTQLSDAWKMKGRQFGSLLTDGSGTIFKSVIDEPYTIRLEYNDDGTTAGRINGIRQAQNDESKYTPQSAAKVVRSATNGSYGFVNDKVREFELHSFKVHALNEGLATVNLAPKGGNIAVLNDGLGGSYVFLKNSAYTTRLEKAPVTFTVTATDDKGENALDAVTVTSDAPSVAAAELSDGTLTITPVGVGSAVITVKNGDVQRVISVTVKEPIAYTDTDYGTTTAFYPANGATGVYEDDHLKITFDDKPVFGFGEDTIDIYEESDLDDPVVSIPVGSIVINTISDGSKSSQNYNLKYFMAQIVDKTVEIIPTCDSLENGKKYVVGIGNGVITGKVNGKDFTGFDPEQKRWSFTVRESKPTPGASITVGTSSNAHFRTVQGALKAVTSNATISVEKGTYREILYYTKAYDITIEGKGTADFGTDVVIVGINCNEYNGTSATRGVFSWNSSNSLTFKNVTLQNAMDRNTMISGGSSQSEALYFNGKYLAAYNSSFKGFQDTLLINKGRAWFYKCYVEGDTDFIWGSADAALFEECEIVQLDTSADSKKTSGSYVFETRVSNESNPTVGKGYVLFNTKLAAKHASSYLARRASAANASGNYYDQSAFINVTVTGELSGAFGGTNYPVFIEPDAGNQHVGIKYYNDGDKGNLDSKLFDSSLFAGKVNNKKYEGTITEAVYNAEYSGRNVILNKEYKKDTGKYKNVGEIWNVSELAAEFNATEDNSKLDEVVVVEGANGVYDICALAEKATGKSSYAQNDELTDGTSDDGYVAWKNLLWHSGSGSYGVVTNNNPNKHGGQPTEITIELAGASVVSWTGSSHSGGTVTVTDSTGDKKIVDGASTKAAGDKVSQEFLYEGATATTLTISFNLASTYINHIKVSPLDGEKNGVKSVSIDGAASVSTGGEGTLTASCTTTYLNDYTPKSYSWSCSDGATISGNGASATITGGSSVTTVTVTCTVDGVSGTKTVTVGEATAEAGKTYSYDLESAEFKDKTGTSTDGLLSWTASGTQNHGIQFGTGNTMTIVVAGSVDVALTCCQFANQGKVTVTDSDGSAVASDVNVSNRGEDGGDKTCTTAKTISYTGGKATKLTFTFTNTAYIHAVTVTPAAN